MTFGENVNIHSADNQLYINLIYSFGQKFTYTYHKHARHVSFEFPMISTTVLYLQQNYYNLFINKWHKTDKLNLVHQICDFFL